MKRFSPILASALVAVVLLASLSGCGSDSVPESLNYTWTRQGSGTDVVLNSVAALDNSHVWAVGQLGTVLFYDGNSWRTEVQPRSITEENLWYVFALDAQHVWAVGWNAVVLFFDGKTWKRVYYEPGSDHDLYSVTATDSQHVWATSLSGAVLTLDGTQWKWQFTGLGGDLNGIYATDPQHIWVVGEEIQFGDGSSWTTQQTSDYYLNKISGQGTKNLMAVGLRDTVYRFSDGKWTLGSTGSKADLRDVKLLANGQAFVAGDFGGEKGIVLVSDGAAWVNQATFTGTPLLGISTFDGSKVWAVGAMGSIYMGVRQ